MVENGAITWTNETRKLCDLVPWENNPREIFKDESERLGESLDIFGQVELLAIGPDNDLYNGHQRKLVWSLLPKYGPDYEVDVRVASRPLTEHEKEQLTVFLHRGTNARWDWDKLATFEVPDLIDWGFSEDELQLNWGSDDLLDVDKDAKPNPRNLPIDVIYTATFPASCCLAVNAGFRYGLQSGKAVCPCMATMGGHDLVFVDCDYENYNHAKHVGTCRQERPKYATVRDYMSESQCANAGIQFYSMDQILDWAIELEQYADSIIIIPKVDVLDKIPERYILGYSVPTSHGGTPLPVETFRGRRVHLLGGSWKAQLAHMAQLGDDVVSLDNNYLGKIAQVGGAVLPDGTRKDLPAYGIDTRVNPAYIALAISLGNVGWKVNELYKDEPEQAASPAPVMKGASGV